MYHTHSVKFFCRNIQLPYTRKMNAISVIYYCCITQYCISKNTHMYYFIVWGGQDSSHGHTEVTHFLFLWAIIKICRLCL